ncbi:hypothetical protein CPB83DRAFT_240747 [Crepidotus variabilis]|uniref:Uncharacterized protein n=1 Tax=Crepidotus variabilis TaxID=179855 RepID=A0A9P6EHR4_9AGAR|nr:hypothetical protein CPB83DRAFT_240747 [Crepidotus variabilis]
MASTTTLLQDILPGPGFPQSINITRTTAIHADEAAAKLLASCEGSPAIGIAYHISKRGKVDFVCLATCSSACLIKFSKPGQISTKGMFASLLASNGKHGQLSEKSNATTHQTILVGFQMARIAVQVNHVTKQAVRGVDLTRLFTSDARDSPADIIHKRLFSAVDSWKVAQLWIGEDDSVSRDLPLQAWLAACIGLRHKDKLASSHLINTDHLHFLVSF